MATVLTQLVEKTANWTVDKLRDELLVLHKLAYPFRNQFDRTKLMMVKSVLFLVRGGSVMSYCFFLFLSGSHGF